MGYTHYWRRIPVLPLAQFAAFSADAQRIFTASAELGAPLAGPFGKGRPRATPQAVKFNGLERCGHEARSLGITWPGKGARGISQQYVPGSDADAPPRLSPLLTALCGVASQMDGTVAATGVTGRDASQDSDVGSQWFAGAHVMARTCGGDCSHESVIIEQSAQREPQADEPLYYDTRSGQEVPVMPDPESIGKVFSCCKTAYKPYDLAVTAVLVAAVHHFGKDAFIVSSDGDMEHWFEGVALCQALFGYGADFTLPGGEDA